MTGTLDESLRNAGITDNESVTPIVYLPQALFRVQAVSRCTAELPGHLSPILTVHFSPSGRVVASGSGDHTLRLWDMNTQTPLITRTDHTQDVLSVCWSPDGEKIGTGGKDGLVCVYFPEEDKVVKLKGHGKRVNSVCWEPFHIDAHCKRLASGSEDASVRIWNCTTGIVIVQFVVIIII
jgi:ribosome assembly protein 4